MADVRGGMFIAPGNAAKLLANEPGGAGCIERERETRLLTQSGAAGDRSGRTSTRGCRGGEPGGLPRTAQREGAGIAQSANLAIIFFLPPRWTMIRRACGNGRAVEPGLSADLEAANMADAGGRFMAR